MARGVLLVISEPVSEAKEAEYNHWYDDVHLKEVLGLAGFTAARRFRVSQEQLVSQGGYAGVTSKFPHKYVAVYEVEADDLATATRSLNEHGRELTTSDAMAYERTTAVLLEEITRRGLGG
jgi:hypothetical protein